MEENKTEVAETGDTLAKPAADIQYYRPLFHRRIFADLLDTIFMALLGVLLFVGFRTAFLNLPESSMRSDRLEQNRSDCGLYVKSDGQAITLKAISTFTPRITLTIRITSPCFFFSLKSLYRFSLRR
jgi:hypothetical protein